MLIEYLEHSAADLRTQEQRLLDLANQYKMFMDRDMREQMEELKGEIRKKQAKILNQVYLHMQEFVLLKKHFPSFSEAIEVFYSQPDERKTNKKLAGLIRIIEEQKAAISRLAEEEVELRHKGELIYHRYSLIKDLIDQLNHAAKKYSFKEIKAKLKENKIIKEVNEAEKKIIIELD